MMHWRIKLAHFAKTGSTSLGMWFCIGRHVIHSIWIVARDCRWAYPLLTCETVIAPLAGNSSRIEMCCL